MAGEQPRQGPQQPPTFCGEARTRRAAGNGPGASWQLVAAAEQLPGTAHGPVSWWSTPLGTTFTLPVEGSQQLPRGPGGEAGYATTWSSA